MPGEGYEQPRISGPGLGPALRIQVDAGAATVAFKPMLGWVLDIDRHTGRVRRVDLARGADRRPSPQPGRRTDDGSTVAAAVSTALEDQPDLEDRTAGSGGPDSTAVSPHQAAAQWLRELGYPDARSSDDAMSVSTEAAHVVVRGPGRAVGLGDVKTAYADAIVAGRSLFMFSCAGYTRPAREWADRAAAALFSLHPDGSAVHPASELAREHLPGML
jgi:hypothetical protein